MSKTLTALTSATTPLAGTESVYVVQGGNSRVTTAASFYIPGGTDVAVVDGGTGSSTAAGARTNLGLVIGTDVQAYDADLTAWAAVNPSSYSTTAQIAAAYQPLDSDLTSWALITRAAGFDTFATTPSSANIKALVTDETGSGSLVFATSPTLVTPALGTPSALVLTNATGLPAAGGGTGIASYAVGDLLYASGATTLAKLGVGRALQGLRQNAGATAPEWGDFMPGYDVTGLTGATESLRIAALYAAAPTQPYMYRADSHFGIIRDTSPLNYQGTRAAFVLQRRDTAAIASNELVPGSIFQFTSTGDGVVTAGSDLSLSIMMGLTSTHTKTGDGSAHPFTAIGELGAYGAGLYNELGLFVGTGTNTGSLHGTMSGVEVLLKDSADSGVTKFDTSMNAVIGRVGRWNAGSRKSRNFYASSEGTVALDAILGVNTSGYPHWTYGIDFVGAIFDSGQAIVIPNNTSIAAMNAAGSSRLPLMFLSSTDVLWLTAAAATGSIVFANSALAKSFQVTGVATSVNFMEAQGNAAGGAPTFWAKGSDTDIGVTWGTKGAGVHSFYTNGTSFAKQVEIGHVASPTSYLSFKGAAAAGHPIIQPGGTETNPGVIIQGKGTGGGFLTDGAAANKFRWSTTGIGFFTTAPVAKQTVGAALSTGGAETNVNLATRINDLRTALINYGLAA